MTTTLELAMQLEAVLAATGAAAALCPTCGSAGVGGPESARPQEVSR